MKRGGMIYAFAQLSDRERGLLLILSGIILPVAVVFLALMPLMEARDRTARAAQEASSTLIWVADQVRRLPVGGAGDGPTITGPAPIGISGIEDSLVQGSLRDFVSQLANRTDGGIDLALEAAPFDDLTLWLQSVLPVWGYRIAAFRIEAVTNGLVNASFELGVGP